MSANVKKAPQLTRISANKQHRHITGPSWSEGINTTFNRQLTRMAHVLPVPGKDSSLLSIIDMRVDIPRIRERPGAHTFSD